MSFKDIFNKYKLTLFVCYALLVSVLLLVLQPFWLKLIFVLPLVALGVLILIEVFPRNIDNYMLAMRADQEGMMEIKLNVIVRAVRNACKSIEDIRYSSCTVHNTEGGIHIKLCIKTINIKVLDASELTRELVKKLVENELQIKIAKIDIIVVNTKHLLTVEKITDTEQAKQPERRAVYSENSPSYLLNFGTGKKVFKVPSAYIEGEEQTLDSAKAETEPAAELEIHHETISDQPAEVEMQQSEMISEEIAQPEILEQSATAEQEEISDEQVEEIAEEEILEKPLQDEEQEHSQAVEVEEELQEAAPIVLTGATTEAVEPALDWASPIEQAWAARERVVNQEEEKTESAAEEE